MGCASTDGNARAKITEAKYAMANFHVSTLLTSNIFQHGQDTADAYAFASSVRHAARKGNPHCEASCRSKNGQQKDWKLWTQQVKLESKT